MKNSAVLFYLLLICIPLCAQQLNFTYALDRPEIVYSFRSLQHDEVIDTTRYAVTYDFIVRKDTLLRCNRMVLEVGQRYVNYYSRAERQLDSTYTAMYGESPRNAVNEYAGAEQIIGNRKLLELTCYNRPPFVTGLVFAYKDRPQFDWELTHATDTVAGYCCHSAKTSFRGRIWNVWFAMEIPDHLGPWKFTGLPGLVLKAEDDDKQFCWECTGITESSSPIKKYEWQTVFTTREKWRKMEQNIFRSPAMYASSQHITLFRVVGNDLKRLDEPWEEVYNPLEIE